MKIPVSDEYIIELHGIIGRLGNITQADYAYMQACFKAGVWDRDSFKEWAVNFTEDPWRNENKRYKTVAHFLRNPEEWMESKKISTEEAWTL